RHAGGAQFDHPVLGLHVREVVAGVGEDHVPGTGVDDGVETGDEHRRGDLGDEGVVDLSEHLRGRVVLLRGGAEHRPARGHHQGRRDTLVGDVSDYHAEPAVGKGNEVVEVAAHSTGGSVEGADVPARYRQQLLGQQRLLDQRRHLELLLDPLPLLGLRLLLPDQLGHPHRGRHLGGQPAEEPPVVGGVGLVGEPGAEIQGTDQLALADQRDYELDPGGPDRVQGARNQLEIRHPDGAAGGQQDRLQRIPGRDRDRVDQTSLRQRGPGGRSAPVLGTSATESLQHHPDVYSPIVPAALRTQTDTAAGCIVSDTTPIHPSTTAEPSRRVCKVPTNRSTTWAASYRERLKRLSTQAWTRRRNGLKEPATARVEPATASGLSVGSIELSAVTPAKNRTARSPTTIM